MMLGKRGRGPMKRTTSMSGINFDLNIPTKDDVVDANNNNNNNNNNNPSLKRVEAGAVGGGLDLKQCRVLGMKHRRNFSDLAPITDFLRTCSFCTRPLLHGRDIYMYRGDNGFCSLECREMQMKQDERKEKCDMESKNHVTKAETVVAL